MKVVFSSRTGNTRRLAEAIAHALECEICPLERADMSACEGPLVLGFWCDKGEIDAAAAAVLPQLAGREVALFFTAGTDAASEAAASMRARFAAQLRSLGAAVVAPVFMAQGQISEQLQAQIVAEAAARGEEVAPERLARWKASAGRPNEDDLAAAHEWALRLAAAARHLASAKAHMNTSHQAACELLADFYGLPAATGAAKGTGAAQATGAAPASAAAQGTGAAPASAGARVLAIDYAGVALERAGVMLRAEFAQPAAQPGELEERIKQLCAAAREGRPRSELAPGEQEALRAETAAFCAEFKSAVIASLRPNGAPLASYAPVIWHEGALYALVSEVAEHFEALTAMKRASVMFVQSEEAAPSVFARKRLRYEVFAQPAHEALREALFAELASSAGAMSEMFKRMRDFHFLRLKILSGRYVKGFGQAFDISSDGQFSPAAAKNPHKMH